MNLRAIELFRFCFVLALCCLISILIALFDICYGVVLVAVEESTREEMRSPGMPMVIRLLGMSIIQLLHMHLVFSFLFP